ncbi:hypothetical protein B0J15DRAFT_156118 [Fusarium solani]|uniref:Uncharacterized protein n=1 Tax=Fusarium solani TaxID=169388 RepID=A0A9P9GA69_FUSSL|nr:uncharacterized protein B0J15DRAFT_156118 [Fusarium solani]KAH7234129.1 hypothetical protein B0J15DRAFT_156118 [Fusarium solani]
MERHGQLSWGLLGISISLLFLFSFCSSLLAEIPRLMSLLFSFWDDSLYSHDGNSQTPRVLYCAEQSRQTCAH